MANLSVGKTATIADKDDIKDDLKKDKICNKKILLRSKTFSVNPREKKSPDINTSPNKTQLDTTVIGSAVNKSSRNCQPKEQGFNPGKKQTTEKNAISRTTQVHRTVIDSVVDKFSRNCQPKEQDFFLIEKKHSEMIPSEAPDRELELYSSMNHQTHQNPIEEEDNVLKQEKPVECQASSCRELELNSSVNRQSPVEEKDSVLNQRKPSGVGQVPSTSRELEFNSNINRQSPIGDEDSLFNQQKPPAVSEVPSTSRNVVQNKDRLDEKFDDLELCRCTYETYSALNWTDPENIMRCLHRRKAHTFPSLSNPDLESYCENCNAPRKRPITSIYNRRLLIVIILGAFSGIILAFFVVWTLFLNLKFFFMDEPEEYFLFHTIENSFGVIVNVREVLDGFWRALLATIGAVF